ncbi:hypothetical protein Tco_0368930 [Tanacetum coccineum]
MRKSFMPKQLRLSEALTKKQDSCVEDVMLRTYTSLTLGAIITTSLLELKIASAMRPLFLTVAALEAKALELRRASLALTLLYLASKSLVLMTASCVLLIIRTILKVLDNRGYLGGKPCCRKGNWYSGEQLEKEEPFDIIRTSPPLEMNNVKSDDTGGSL